MNRGIETEDGRAVLWHNFYGSEKTNEDDLIREFEENAQLLKERSNGNVLYHEILSFSKGHKLKEEELIKIVTDIGATYLSDRASRQMAYGVIHQDTGHIHLHLMISSNAYRKSDRVRLSKKEFSDIQKRVEALALEKYPQLAQTKIYGRERPREKLKTDAREQAMKTRSREPSRKESLKARLHQLFEQARSYKELADRSKAEGFSFYQRGKTVGVMVRDPDGTERRHRLSTLGLEVHYETTNRRLGAPVREPEPERRATAPELPSKVRLTPEKVAPRPRGAEKSAPERVQPAPPASPTALEQEIARILGKSDQVRDQDGDAPRSPPNRGQGKDRDDDW